MRLDQMALRDHIERIGRASGVRWKLADALKSPQFAGEDGYSLAAQPFGKYPLQDRLPPIDFLAAVRVPYAGASRRRFMPATGSARAIPELSVVALTRPLEHQGKLLPEGTKGAVVYIYRDGGVYEVEFVEPFHCVVTLRRDDIQPT